MSDLHKKRHLFHIVDPSPWPLFSALGAFLVTTNAVLFFMNSIQFIIIL